MELLTHASTLLFIKSCYFLFVGQFDNGLVEVNDDFEV